MVRKTYLVELKSKFLRDLIGNRIQVVIVSERIRQDGKREITIEASDENHNKLVSLGYQQIA